MIRVKDIRSGKGGGEERAKSSLFSISDIRNPSGDVRMNQQQEYANAMKSSRLREVAQVKEERKSSQSFTDKLKVTQGLMSGKKVPAASAKPKVDIPANNPLTTVLQTRETLKKASKVTGDAPNKSTPLLKKIVSGVKGFANKSGITKDVGYLADAAGSVLNAPGDLIRQTTKLAHGINDTIAKSGVAEKLHLPPVNPVLASGAKTLFKGDIPGVTTGPAANFVRGWGDAFDFGTGRALDEAFGNTEYLAGRDTKAGRAGQIAGVVAPVTGGLYALAKAGVRKGVQSVRGAMETVQGSRMSAIDAAARPDLPANVSRGSMVRVNDTRKPSGPGIREEVAQSAAPIESPTKVDINPPSSKPVKQNWFTALFGEQGVGISAVASKKRIRDKPLTSEDVIVKKSLKDDRDGIKDAVSAQFRKQYQNYTDMLDPLKYAGDNVYDAAMDANRGNQLANNIVGKDFVTPEGVRIGDGMEALFKKVPRGLDEKFIDYLIKRDAEARIPRGERVYDESLRVPNPDNPMEHIPLNSERAVRASREALEKRYPWMAQLGKEWDQFTKNLREVYGVNEGILSKEASDAMQLMRPNYIKMMREFSRSEKPGRKYLGQTSATTFSGLKAPIKKVSPTGSPRNIVNPRKTMSEYVGAMVNNAMRNRAMQKLHQNVLNDPEGMQGIARIVPETGEATKKSMVEINRILESDGLDGLMEKLNNDFELAFKKAGQKGGQDNIVTAMIGGRPVKIEILNPEVALAIQGMNPTQAGIVTAAAQKFSNAVKRSATGPLAPLFAAKSVTMDLMSALVQSDNKLRFIPDYFHAIFSSVGDKLNIPGLSNMARDFRLAGGGYSAALRGERSLNKAAKNLDRLPLLSARNVGRQALRWNPISASFKLGEGISDIFENAPRMAAARGKLRQLGGEKTPGNVRQAMNASREITTNYSRRGRNSNEIEAWMPYSNAAMQGLYRITRQVKTKPLQTAAAVSALSVLPKLHEYAQFHDDPDYQNLPARERFRNLIWSKNDDGTFNKIPMAPEYAVFGELTIDALRYFRNNDEEAFKGSMDAISNAWLPPLASNALQGVTQGGGIEQSGWGIVNATSFGAPIGAMANQSFTGAPIESMKVADRSPKNRYDERTSGVAKWVGQQTGWSPMKIDYVLRQYGGDPVRLLMPLTTEVGGGTPKNTLLRNFIVDPVFTNNLANDFYDGKDMILQAATDNADVGAPLPKWYNEDLKKKLTSAATGKKAGVEKSITVQLRELSASKVEVQKDRGLTAGQKSQKLRDIQRKINEIYIDVNAEMERAGVPLLKR